MVRKQYIEDLRVISMMAVVLIHICITALSDFPDQGGTLWRVVYLAVRNLLHFAVPVFFMISGALLLPPEKKMPLEKLKSYLVKYGAVILVFGWGFALAEEVFAYKSLAQSYFYTSFLNMLQGRSWNHMWYMYELFGVMLILPVLRVVVKLFSKQEMKYLLIVGIVFMSVIPYICSMTGGESGVSLPLSSIYCIYMLVGYLLDTVPVKKNSTVLAATAVVIVAVLLIAEAYFSIVRDIELNFSSYSSPFVFLLSASLYHLVHQKRGGAAVDPEMLKKTKAVLSVNSFGIYIIHMFWINLAYKFLKIDPFTFVHPLVGMLVLWVIVLLLSLVSTMIMRSIPVLKKIV